MTRSRAQERGSINLMLVVSAVALFIAIGLVVDGGGRMRASQYADSVAAEAARAGAQAIHPDVIASGGLPHADALRAAAAADSHLAVAGVEGSASVDGQTITVVTSTTYEPIFLNAIGVGPATLTGRATIELTRGL